MHRILYRLIAALARLAVRSGRAKDLEIIVGRHHLLVLRRQLDRPALTNNDRSLMGAMVPGHMKVWVPLPGVRSGSGTPTLESHIPDPSWPPPKNSRPKAEGNVGR